MHSPARGAIATSGHVSSHSRAHAVRACDDRRCDLADLTVEELRQASGLGDKAALIGDDVHTVLTLEGSVASRNHIGGTAPDQVRAAIAAARKTL